MTDKEKIELYEKTFTMLYINRNLSLDVKRMHEILDAIDFFCKFDPDKNKGTREQKLKALSI